MINDPLYNQLREQAWRCKPGGDEEPALRAWLAAHPEAQADWEGETALSEALARLPDAPMPSNFTARVLQAVEREVASAKRHHGRKWQFWGRLRWLPKAAVAAVVVGAGLISYHQAALSRNRERVEAVVVVSRDSSLPSPDVLKDFDAIQTLSQTPADEELLAALK